MKSNPNKEKNNPKASELEELLSEAKKVEAEKSTYFYLAAS